MGHPIDDHFDVQTTADQLAAARAELRNAKALADKLQTLLDSKTHEVDALHTELARACHAQQMSEAERDRWMSRSVEADNTVDAMLKVLRPHAAPAYSELGTPLDVARNVVASLEAPEPDIDTVPLADLLEAIGTYLEHDQAVTIRGSYEPVRQIEIHAMGLTFAVDTHEASEALTKLQELGGCVVVEAAR